MKTNLRTIKDGNYCWIDKRILRLLNGFYEKSYKKRRTARSIYLSLAEIASDNNNRSFYTCSRAHISSKSAVSPSTLDRYLTDFIRMGIVKKENRKSENRNLVNLWYLLPYPSIQYLGHTLRDDKSHYVYNNDEGLPHNNSEGLNKHIKEERVLISHSTNK